MNSGGWASTRVAWRIAKRLKPRFRREEPGRMPDSADETSALPETIFREEAQQRQVLRCRSSPGCSDRAGHFP